jgi:hypothetical protein
MTARSPPLDKGKRRLEDSDAAAASLRRLSLEPQVNGGESSRGANGARPKRPAVVHGKASSSFYCTSTA